MTTRFCSAFGSAFGLAAVSAWLLALSAPQADAREEPAVGQSQDPLKVAPPPPQGPNACRQGYVWREARPGDHVCVSPQVRDQVAGQNRSARRLWVNGPYGPHTCVEGYVWREAFKGDDVCVEPRLRDRARDDNQRAAQRRVGG